MGMMHLQTLQLFASFQWGLFSQWVYNFIFNPSLISVESSVQNHIVGKGGGR